MRRSSGFDRLLEIGGGRGRILPMEGMRGLAALLVFLVHYGVVFAPWAGQGWTAGWAGGWRALGQAGVEIFFVISGYLIYGMALERTATVGAFWARRARRIYPAFLAAWGFTLAASWLVPGQMAWAGWGNWGRVVADLLLLPGLVDLEPLVAVAWSMSYEVAYYLSVPLIVLLFRKRSAAVRCLWVAGLALAYGVGIVLFFPAQWPALRVSPWHHWRLLLFAFGALAWEAVRAGGFHGGLAGGWGRRWGETTAWVLLAAAGPIYTALYNPQLAQPWAALARTLWMGLVFGWVSVAAYGGGTGRLEGALAWTPLRWLGNLSYSFYLAHGAALQAVHWLARRLTPPDPGNAWGYWLWMPVALMAAGMAALALFAGVEKPFSLTRRPARDRFCGDSADNR